MVVSMVSESALLRPIWRVAKAAWGTDLGVVSSPFIDTKNMLDAVPNVVILHP